VERNLNLLYGEDSGRLHKLPLLKRGGSYKGHHSTAVAFCISNIVMFSMSSIPNCACSGIDTRRRYAFASAPSPENMSIGLPAVLR
jgi:hypothetical protein